MPVSRKIKAIRKILLNTAAPHCFYCGLPFHAFVWPKASPYAARSRAFVKPTLEHLLARSRNGGTTNDNCVLAHSWCNTLAGNRPVTEKLRLKQTLSGNKGIFPWYTMMQRGLKKSTRE